MHIRANAQEPAAAISLAFNRVTQIAIEKPMQEQNNGAGKH